MAAPPDAQDPRAPLKRSAGEAAAALVTPGQRIGLGSGSTFHYVLAALAARWAGGLRFVGTPTSEATRQEAERLGIPLAELDGPSCLDVAIDGADEVASDGSLIKGGGGALLRETLVAAAARRFVVVVDADKLVTRLGRHPVPVEVAPFGWQATAARIAFLGGSPVLRVQGSGPVVTDNGHYILDCAFGLLDDPAQLHTRLKQLPGVMETGLFCGMTTDVVIGDTGGVRWWTPPPPSGNPLGS
jgi:ribose 5-phosphate isomerase A